MDNMRVMICLGQGGLRSLSASSYLCEEYIIQCNTCRDFSNYTARFILWEDSLRMFFLKKFCDLSNNFMCNCDAYMLTITYFSIEVHV